MAVHDFHDLTEAAGLFAAPVQDAPLGSEEVTQPGNDLEWATQQQRQY